MESFDRVNGQEKSTQVEKLLPGNCHRSQQKYFLELQRMKLHTTYSF